VEYWGNKNLNSFCIHPTLHYSNIPLTQLRIYFRQRDPSISKVLFWDFIENNPDPIRRNLKHLDDSFRHFFNQLFLLLRCPSLNHADLNNRHHNLLSNNRIQGFEGSRVQGSLKTKDSIIEDLNRSCLTPGTLGPLDPFVVMVQILFATDLFHHQIVVRSRGLTEFHLKRAPLEFLER
jgi:hypothetical protein